MLADIAVAAAARFGDRIAFVDAQRRPMSYRELERQSAAIARGMLTEGIAAGQVVALTLPSTPSYIAAYVAAARVGAITAGVNPGLALPERQRCLDVADPSLTLASEDDVAALAHAGATDDAPLPALPPDPDRPVAIVFTSGSTGLPKGATFTNRQIAAIVEIDVNNAWGNPTEPPVAMLAATQFAHVGFTTKLAWYLQLGTTTHLLARWRAADVLDVVERERLSSIGGIAPQIALLLRAPDFDQRDVSSVQTLIAGGGPSSPALVEEARRRFNAKYSIRYSSTESGGVGAGTAFDADDHEAMYTVGRPRPGVEIRVIDDEGRPLPVDEVGRVAIRSGAVMAGYWGAPEATAGALVDGWLHTDDLGRIDGSGCLVLAGRRSEMFIRGGYNVFPMEVEAVLGDHPGVAQVAVVPVSDPVMGERGLAVVVPADPGAPPTLDDLRSFAENRLARFKLPEDIRVVPALPLTSAAKIDRALLRQEAREQAGDQGIE